MYRIVPALIPFILVLAVASDSAPAADSPARPNLVYILCDDLGYGDVKCLNPEGKIPTPNMDRIAAAGMTFTDAHSGSSVCSPTRYGVLTGRYSWRSRLKHGVLGGLSPRLIEPDRMTVAAFLRQHGYHTAAIGKWHLGMDWVKLTGRDVAELNIESAEQVRNVDFSKPIANGPNSVGFDYYFGISASLDMVPYTFIENDRVTALPTEDADFEMMPGKPGRTRRGPRAPEFDAIDVLPRLTEKAVEYIGQRAADAKAGRPFFLYLPLNAPHTPTLPTPQWQGKSGLNAYGDFVMQTDATVGRVLDALDQHGLTDTTLVVFTSDNGCSPQADFAALAEKGHHPSYHFRGHKADIFDGGHRIPFLVRWPGKVQAGTKCEQLICLTDLLATCADILDASLPDDAGEDSVSILPALLGTAPSPLREAVVHHSINGSFAIRQGPWKLELCSGSGGWSAPRPGSPAERGLPPVQLYNLETDVGETANVQDQHPEIVQRLTALLEKYVAEGRSTPGAKQANTTPVEIRKASGPGKVKPKARSKAK
ncbi:MAG TPA: arylsulfatase [Candidatus Anammoximicrobium sp.]|nr:arylsulfatase [Candidatus Anammoximicrobium sp.]